MGIFWSVFVITFGDGSVWFSIKDAYSVFDWIIQ